ncbi:hypothetical protein OHB12_07975 [Nocardia sp. NBC_01730]|uniref:hypothetical protein n=1 Tax=Nocardia sp. NBC_01730 TaxID=2975998 RepID=UPI002E0F0B5A|nr:hypothetical protein OHB12_07975 [Nocardia sp. NBC_01730]
MASKTIRSSTDGRQRGWASTPLPGLDLAEPMAGWMHTGETVEVDADHFSIIGPASSAAAEEIRRWLAERGGPEPRSS